EIMEIGGGKNIIRISLAGQEIHAVLGAQSRKESWICPGNDVYMIINRIKTEIIEDIEL
ncbi:hypothetical protein MNBD_ALPHA02-1564, partial [hydrothermal vent metagenome]